MNDLQKQLEMAIANLDRQYGKNTVVRMGSNTFESWPAISTGALTLDTAIGIGGMPMGRIVEVYGAESCGKSTLALSVIANAQKMGLTCAFIDAEHALDPKYASAVGVNMEELLISQPDYGEQALEIVDALIGTEAVGVIVIDSVAALVPKAELEGDMDQQSMGLQARLMSKALRKITGKASQTKTLVIFINQLREKIGVFYGNPEVTSGGRGLKFFSSVRIDMRRKGDIVDQKTGEILGIQVKTKLVKNKMGPPYRIAEFDIVYGKGISTIGCLIDVAVEKNVLTKKGSWYSFGEESLAQGRDSAIKKLEENLELRQLIEKKVAEVNVI